MKRVRKTDLEKYVKKIYAENMLKEGNLSAYMNGVVVNVNSFCICILDYNRVEKNKELLEQFSDEINLLSLQNLGVVSIRLIEGEEFEIEIYISISDNYEVVMN